jgi:hypothetical protein
MGLLAWSFVTISCIKEARSHPHVKVEIENARDASLKLPNTIRYRKARDK